MTLFWTLVLGFGTESVRTLAALRRMYETTAGATIAASAFHDRFVEGLVRLLRAAVARACDEARQCAQYGAVHLAAFADVVAIDGSVLRLREALADTFPGTRTNHSPAAAKLHLVTSVVGRGPRSVKITDERTHDGKVRHLGAWVRGCLLLFDLGYYNFRAFSSITRNRGFFITRLKTGANPELLAIINATVTDVIKPGERLRDVLARARRNVIDVTVRLCFRRRAYRGTTHGAAEVFRVVAVRHPVSRRFHVYVTNIGADRLAADEIAATYAGRWAIELIFKELKTTYRLDELSSAKKHVVEALILSAILTMIVSGRLLQQVAARLPERMRHRLRPLRWAKVFAAHAPMLLLLILSPRSISGRAKARWLLLLERQAIDPNVSRYDLRQLMCAVQISLPAPVQGFQA